ncbi:MAG: sugar phosphate isomerase/epimerase [Oscillospiraceae bacterium]|nr:sugar phosphate isomerase/epimerase [Oscillospiraceae bacterium]
MKIVTTTSVFPPGTDWHSAILRLKNAGFSSLDFAFDYCDRPEDPLMGPDYAEWAASLRKYADSLGLEFTHSHAPFDADARGEIVEHTLHAAQILGVRYLVVHPLWRKADEIYYEGEEFLEVNTAAYLPLAELAENYGLTILTENLLWGASIQPRAISDLVARVNRPNFGWCYDSGHAHCFGISPETLIGLIPPLSLHLQDNYGIPMGDEHLLPGDGTIDWDLLLKTLVKIGYSGEFVLEAHRQSCSAPDNERDAILKELCSRAETYRSRII